MKRGDRACPELSPAPPHLLLVPGNCCWASAQEPQQLPQGADVDVLRSQAVGPGESASVVLTCLNWSRYSHRSNAPCCHSRQAERQRSIKSCTGRWKPPSQSETRLPEGYVNQHTAVSDGVIWSDIKSSFLFACHEATLRHLSCRTWRN